MAVHVHEAAASAAGGRKASTASRSSGGVPAASGSKAVVRSCHRSGCSSWMPREWRSPRSDEGGAAHSPPAPVTVAASTCAESSGEAAAPVIMACRSTVRPIVTARTSTRGSAAPPADGAATSPRRVCPYAIASIPPRERQSAARPAAAAPSAIGVPVAGIGTNPADISSA
eukprot:scaffold31633_cov96-Isochrysis_galbana.AAC.1